MSKRILILTLLLIGLQLTLSAESFANFDKAGNNSESVVVSGISAWKWVVAFLPFAFGTYSAFKVNEYLNQKDESSGGQQEPKVSRYAKVLSAFIVAVIIVYLVLGTLGLVFAGQSFADTWDTFVIKFWEQIFS